MRLLFFDFTIQFGGGPQGTVYLARRLCSGNEVHVVDAYGCCRPYANALADTKARRHVLCPDAQETYIGREGEPLARLASLVRQAPALWEVRRRLTRKVLEISPDVIWVNNEKSLAFLCASWSLRRFPIVFYYRGWGRPEQVGLRLRSLLRLRTAAVLTHARAAREQLRLAGVPGGKIRFTPNVIDAEATLARAKEPPDEPAPAPGRSPIILVPAARLTREKGLDTAVESLRMLKRRGTSARLWLPGTEAVGDRGDYVEGLKRKIAEYGLERDVEFLGWREDMPALIKAADIVALPSHTEGLPRAILEAMLLKRPVCAAPVGGIPEVITHGRTGMLFGVRDAGGLAGAVETLAGDPAARGRIVEGAYDFFRGTCDPREHTRAVLEAFESARRR